MLNLLIVWSLSGLLGGIVHDDEEDEQSEQ